MFSSLPTIRSTRPGHRFVATSDGVDILPAPETPYTGPVDAARLHAVLEHARMNYDWIVIDLPVVFQRLSLMTISESGPCFSGLHVRVTQPPPVAAQGSQSSGSTWVFPRNASK